MATEDEDKRLFRRVDVLIPFGFRPVGRGAVQSIVHTEKESFHLNDDPVRAALDRIERKVDRLLARLESGDQTPPVQPKRINLSGSGVRFSSDDPLEEGQYLDLAMVLPGESPVALRAVGEVVRQRLLARPSGAVYEIAVSFVDLAPADRESIIRYTFQATGR
ncbi:MAG TPA: PilZ domain-containing protein [Nitrospiria bacterium]|nr:PilZ domain-containing protein [Nitrospiria bacterium]